MRTRRSLTTTLAAFFGSVLLLGSCKKEESEPVPTPEPPPAPTLPTSASLVPVSMIHDSITDIDGNQYYTILIGGQEWMAENLRTTRYRNGDTIPNVTDNTAWTQLSTAAWCNYANDTFYTATYGRLYNWHAAADSDLCPQGWHVPTDTDWMGLETALGMPAADLDVIGQQRGIAENVGGRLKSTSSVWMSPNTGATNASGFTGLPCGPRDDLSGSFLGLGGSGGWWSSSVSDPVNDPDRAWVRHVFYSGSFGVTGVGRSRHAKATGTCVRCLKD